MSHTPAIAYEAKRLNRHDIERTRRGIDIITKKFFDGQPVFFRLGYEFLTGRIKGKTKDNDLVIPVHDHSGVVKEFRVDPAIVKPLP
mgnify:CR=1 FL=1